MTFVVTRLVIGGMEGQLIDGALNLGGHVGI